MAPFRGGKQRTIPTTVNYNYRRPGFAHQSVAKRNAVRTDLEYGSRLYGNNRQSGGMSVAAALIDLQGFGRENLEEEENYTNVVRSNGPMIISFLFVLSIMYLFRDFYLKR